MGGMDGIKGERSEQQSDRAEKYYQNRFYLGGFEVEKSDFSLKMLCGYIQNCASYSSVEHIFRKIMNASGRKVKN